MHVIRSGMVMAWVVLIAAGSYAESLTLHGGWDGLLRRHVDEEGMVSYAGFREDGGVLKGYLDLLGKTDPAAFNRDGKLAYWINAYNAFTVQLILNHYPIKSIRKVTTQVAPLWRYH